MSRQEIQNGPPLVGKLAELIIARRTLDSFGRITVVVPSIYSAVYLRRALVREAVRRGSGLFNVAFKRIEDVSDALLQHDGGFDGVKQMSRIVASEIILGAISGNDGNGYLGNAANKHRFVDSIRATVHDLERLPGGARAALERLSQSNSSPIYRELLAIYDVYAERSKGWLTRAQLADEAARIVRSGSGAVSDVIGGCCVLVMPDAASDTHRPLWDALAELDISESLSLAGFSDGVGNSVTYQRFYSTLSALDAPRQLLRNVMEDARAGIKFGDMAVFVPDMNTATRLRAGFQQAGVPVAGQDPHGLSSTLAGKFVLQFVDAILKGMRRETLMVWLTSNPVVSPSSGALVASTRWDYIGKRARVTTFAVDSDWQRRMELYRRSVAYQVRRLEREHDIDDDEGRTASLNSLRTELTLVDELVEFVSALLIEVAKSERPKSWRDHVACLQGVSERYLAMGDDRADQLPGMAQVQGVLDSISELDKIDGDGADAKIPFSRFAETVRSGISSVAGRRRGLGRGVLISQIDAGIGAAYESVHVMELSETAYQAGGTDHPMLRDRDRVFLNDGSGTLPTIKSRQDAARKSFELAVSSSRRCSFYWNRSHIGDTSDSFPSPLYLNRLSGAIGRTVTAEDAMAGGVPEIELERPLHEVVMRSDLAWEPYGARLVRLNGAKDRPGADLGLADYQPPALAYDSFSMRASSRFTEYDGYVGMMDEFGSGITTSASRYESYARCPYSYFLGEVLSVEGQPDVDDEFRLSPIERGQLVHEILDAFVKNRASIGANPSDDRLLRHLCDEAFSEFELRSFAPPVRLWELEKRNIVRRLRRWRQFEPEILDSMIGRSEVETQFGYGGGARVVMPVSLRNGEEVEVAFRGRIDRIAFGSDGNAMLVVDYKTGSPAGYQELNKDSVDHGTRLQLPIYLLAASLMFPEVIPDLVSGFFWFVFESDRGSMLAPRSRLEWRQVEPRLREVVRTITQGIRNGEFPVRPGKMQYQSGNWENCKLCPFDVACDSSRDVVWLRKRASVPLEYVSMVEPEEAGTSVELGL